MSGARSFLAWVVMAVSPWGLHAQDARQIGSALEEACAASLDPATQAVLVGTVFDSLSSVALGGATVRASWRTPGDTADTVLETETDARGFYGFCGLPAGARVAVGATLRIRSEPHEVEMEAGMLHVEPIRLALSTSDSKGTLVGRIFDPRVREPVGDAQVRLVELDQRTMTNPRGYFSFGSQPWGVYTLEISRLGYAPLTTGVRVAGNLTQMVEIQLAPDALELEGITVSVAPQASGRQIDGLVRRMTLGFGQFITRERIERRPGARVADLLQEVPGVVVRRGLYGNVTLEVRGRSCVPDVYVDGVLYGLDPEAGLDFHAGELEAMEVYRGVETPGEFMRVGRAFFPCAVVVVWTRRGP